MQVKSDNKGRYIIANCNIENYNFTLCGVYGPNKDVPEFYIDLFKELEMRGENKLVIGDYNLVMNAKMDRYMSNENNVKSKQIIEQFMTEFSLVDIWRIQNPDKVHFSWRRKNIKGRLQASRIDFALVSRGLDSAIKNCVYVPAYQTDHQALHLAIATKEAERGPGFWKLNNNLLREPSYLHLINEVLIDRKVKYERKHPGEAWELIKKDIRLETQNYARDRAEGKQLAISTLLEKIGEYEDLENLTENAEKELYNLKREVDELSNENSRAMIFRSKARWYEEGEKSTKYFYNLEKANYNAKTVHSLLIGEEEISNDRQILNEQRKYYEKLYKADDEVCFKIENKTGIYVKSVDRKQQNGPINETELNDALASLKNGKCPGKDGLSADFYKVFWKHLRPILMRVIETVESEMSLTSSQRQGVLNLIPKPGKDSRFLQNLRPKTLLNTDYKLIEKVISNRMQVSMDQLINHDQKGFLPGRRISGNIRKIFDVMKYSRDEKIRAVILNLDFQKCFDQISMSAITGALEYFNFSDKIKKWVQILYTDFSVIVQNNGYFSLRK